MLFQISLCIPGPEDEVIALVERTVSNSQTQLLHQIAENQGEEALKRLETYFSQNSVEFLSSETQTLLSALAEIDVSNAKPVENMDSTVVQVIVKSLGLSQLVVQEIQALIDKTGGDSAEVVVSVSSHSDLKDSQILENARRVTNVTANHPEGPTVHPGIDGTLDMIEQFLRSENLTDYECKFYTKLKHSLIDIKSLPAQPAKLLLPNKNFTQNQARELQELLAQFGILNNQEAKHLAISEILNYNESPNNEWNRLRAELCLKILSKRCPDLEIIELAPLNQSTLLPADVLQNYGFKPKYQDIVKNLQPVDRRQNLQLLLELSESVSSHINNLRKLLGEHPELTAMVFKAFDYAIKKIT